MKREVVRGLLLQTVAAVLAGISVELYYLKTRFMLDAFDSWHASIMRIEQAAPIQYRVISYWIPELITRALGIEPWLAYLFERFFFLYLVAVLFYGFSRRWLSSAESVLTLLAFFYLYNLSVYAHFQPAEEINLLVFLLGFMAIERRKFGWLLLVMALGTLNKQTVVFLIPIHAAYEAIRAKEFTLSLAARSLILAFTFFALRFAVRFAIGERPPYTDLWQIEYNLRYLESLDPRGLYFLLPSLIPMGLILASWRVQPILMRALTPTIVLFVISHFLIARLLEFRLFMPLAFVTLPATILFFRQFISSEDATITVPTNEL